MSHSQPVNLVPQYLILLFRSLLDGLQKLEHIAYGAAWREKEHADLNSIMQRRIHNLQVQLP